MNLLKSHTGQIMNESTESHTGQIMNEFTEVSHWPDHEEVQAL